MKYSISTLFAATAFAAVVVWCSIPQSQESLIRFIIAVLLVGAGAALYFQKARPYRAAAIYGFSFVGASAAYWWTLFWVECLIIHDEHYPYFEGGPITEGIIYPMIYCILYGPVASAIAVASAFATTIRVSLRPRELLSSILCSKMHP